MYAPLPIEPKWQMVCMWAMQYVPAVVDQLVDGYVSEELPSTSSSSPSSPTAVHAPATCRMLICCNDVLPAPPPQLSWLPAHGPLPCGRDVQCGVWV